MPGPAVELLHVGKTYREGDSERAVLSDVSLAIEPGEIVVLVGRSGSGKSTLLNLIAGIDRPTAGRVVVDGTDLTALDEDARTRFRRRRIGFVFQFFNLIPLLSVEENLLLPLELNGGRAAGRRCRLTSDRRGPWRRLSRPGARPCWTGGRAAGSSG
jgi:putative ABC transport system ATP-binding protein